MESDLNCYFQPTWEMSSIDQNAPDPFESALSSMVSSPTAAGAAAASNGADFVPGDGMMIRELIGRLGSICDSAEISCIGTGNNSTNTSCYSTPLNSPPKRFNLAASLIPMQDGNFPNYPSNLGSLNADPGFVERAAKFSCFGSGGFAGDEMGIKNFDVKSGKLSRVSSNLSVKNANPENGDSREGSSVSQNDANSKKRKSIPKANLKDSSAKIDKVEAEKEKSNAKRSKKDDEVGKKENAGDSKNNNNNNSNDNNTNQKQNNEKTNSNENKEKEGSKAEPPKDYIHVRARRGQATDSHSLAERVRREKISERMKFLQDLVPGCNKVTGKATVLDEIINYVQSLQRQVEFLSMKLATVNPRTELNIDALLSSKDMFSTNGSPMTQTMYQYDQNSTQAFPLGYQPNQQLPLPSFAKGTPNGINENPLSLNPLNNAGIRRNPSLQLPSIHGFSDSMTQMPNFWEDDLQSIVQMGITQNQAQNIAGNLGNVAQMKAEL